MAKSKNLWFNLGAVVLAIVIVGGIVMMKQGRKEVDQAVYFKNPVKPEFTFVPETFPTYSPTPPIPGDTPLASAEVPQPSTRYLKIVEEQEKDWKIAEQQRLEREKTERDRALKKYARIAEDQVLQMKSFYLEKMEPLLIAIQQGNLAEQLQIIRDKVEEFKEVRPLLGEEDRLKAKEIDELSWEMYQRIMDMAVSGELSGPDSKSLLRKAIQEELDRVKDSIDKINNNS